MYGNLVGVRYNIHIVNIFDTDNENAQVGGDIDLGLSTGFAMSDRFIASLLSVGTPSLKVFEIETGSQVGNTISLESGGWEHIVMTDRYIAIVNTIFTAIPFRYSKSL